MENLFLFLATSFALRPSAARLRRYLLFPGCSVSLPSGLRTIQVRHTKEADKLFFHEYTVRDVRYGMICVQMRQSYSLPKAERILVDFINRARKPFSIACNAAMEVETGEGLLTITDYWQDQNGTDWKIKGSTNGRVIGLLYVKNISGATVRQHDGFLEGFRIPPLA